MCLLQYSFETLFRSLHYALMDNSCREYLFICDFFIVSGTGAQNLFDAIFGKTLSMFLVRLKNKNILMIRLQNVQIVNSGM